MREAGKVLAWSLVAVLLALHVLGQMALDAELEGFKTLDQGNKRKTISELDAKLARYSKNFIYINGWLDGREGSAPNAF
jgi:hypothetical protein